MALPVTIPQQSAKRRAKLRHRLSFITNLHEARGTAGEGDRLVRKAQGEAVD